MAFSVIVPGKDTVIGINESISTTIFEDVCSIFLELALKKPALILAPRACPSEGWDLGGF